MKSRYICMFACLWGLGFLFSCDGFLNENPKDKIPEEDAYKNLTDLRSIYTKCKQHPIK